RPIGRPRVLRWAMPPRCQHRLPPDVARPGRDRSTFPSSRDDWLGRVSRDAEECIKREQSDLLAERNHADEWFDFHSLRHTCGAWLALSGATVKLVQTIMRHSTPVLTMNRYGHLLPNDTAEAADQLGALVSLTPAQDDAENNVVQMTGTDG